MSSDAACLFLPLLVILQSSLERLLNVGINQDKQNLIYSIANIDGGVEGILASGCQQTVKLR